MPDLHFTSAQPTDEERAAIDTFLDAQIPRRDLLLPALHAVNDRIGWISSGALNLISERLDVAPAEAYGVATFYAMFSMKSQPPKVVHVCDDIACQTNGAEALCAELERTCGKARNAFERRQLHVAAQPVSRTLRTRSRCTRDRSRSRSPRRVLSRR